MVKKQNVDNFEHVNIRHDLINMLITSGRASNSPSTIKIIKEADTFFKYIVTGKTE